MGRNLFTKDLQRILYFVNLKPNEVAKAQPKIQEYLQMKAGDNVTLCHIQVDGQTILHAICASMNRIIDGLEEIIKPQKIALQKRQEQSKQLETIIRASDAFANLKRNLSIKTKANEMSEELLSEFER